MEHVFVGDKIEAADPDGLSIWYLACNGFILRTASMTMYLDPYFGDCGLRASCG